MKRTSKFLVAAVIIGIASFIGVREMSSACGPAPKADEHGHGHAESESHASEGFGTKVCEAGLFSAISQTLAGNTAPANPASIEPASGEEEGHKHAEGEKGHAEEKKSADGHDHGAGAEHKEEAGGEGFIKLSAAQIEAAGIDIAPAVSGKLVKEIAVPGRIAVNANAQAKIVPKLSGTAARIEKQLGDTVKKGDLLVSIESREIADAKAEYLASWRAEELARSISEREERLWKQKVTAEQDYLTAKNTQQAAQIKLDLAHQKLHAIGLEDDDIKALPKLADESAYRSYEIRSPINGRVTSRDIVLGQIVGTDKEIFTIADLSKVWVELAIAPGDLSFAREGQEVRVQVGSRTATAKVIALSPVIDPETRSAKAIAELDNAAGEWQLGDYANAKLISGGQEAQVLVPLGAIQTINGKKAVFVSEGGGFRMKPVTTGREDSVHAEIISGLEFGETIATTNTFTLKAELGKSEAEHEH